MKVKVIKMANTNKRYEPEFKKKMVRLVLEEGRTIASVNKEYNLGEGTVRSWIRQFEEECEKNPEIKETKDIYEENRRLRKKLEEAEKEKKKQQILSIYYEYDRRPGYRRMVIFLRRKGKIILHSDQGSQYTSRAFTEFCKGKGIQQSTSKAGCPYDNSPMESFYGTCLTISVFQTCLAPVTRITLKKSLSFKNLRSSSRVIYFITHLRIFMKIYD